MYHYRYSPLMDLFPLLKVQCCGSVPIFYRSGSADLVLKILIQIWILLTDMFLCLDKILIILAKLYSRQFYIMRKLELYGSFWG